MNNQNIMFNNVATMNTSEGVLEFNGDVITKHFLFIGATGSGKTTSMNKLIFDFVNFSANDKNKKLGLLVFDFKKDATSRRIREWAKNCGRENDIVVVSLNGEYFYNPLAPLKSLKDVNEIMNHIVGLAPERGSNTNPYFQYALEKHVVNTLTAMLLLRESGVTSYLNDFVEYFKLMFPDNIDSHLIKIVEGLDKKMPENPKRKEIKKKLVALKKTFSKIVLPDSLEKGKDPKKYNRMLEDFEMAERYCSLIDAILADMGEWDSLCEGTKSNECTTISNLCAKLSNAVVMNFMFKSYTKKELNLEEILNLGKIVIIDAPASTDAILSECLGKMLKAEFYKILQNREVDFNSDDRLVGLIMDEYPLVATGGKEISSDILNLQTCRSKRGFVVAATQGLSSIDVKLNYHERSALMANFGNIFIFQSNEQEVKELVASHIDETLEKPFIAKKRIGFMEESVGNASADSFSGIRTRTLEVREAYVKTASGKIFSKPIFIEPLFDNSKSESTEEYVFAEERVLRKAKEYNGALRPPSFRTLSRELEKKISNVINNRLD